MRTTALLAMLAAGCAVTVPPATNEPAAVTASMPDPSTGDYGMTIEEEAQILMLEDRRQYDAGYFGWWVSHPNALHRQRAALALGRIGPHAFADANGNGLLDPGEARAGVADLRKLAGDPDRRVRETVALALGEIGDPSAVEPLFQLATDPDGSVAGEAVEALSKLVSRPDTLEQSLGRYFALTAEPRPEGTRTRAVRYLFRLNDDRASAVAAEALASTSSAVRQEASYTLSRRAYPPALERLELVLTDGNVLTRAYAVTAIGRIGSPASVRRMIAALGDPHPWVRTNAAVALSRIAEKDRGGLRADDLPRLFAASEDPDPGVRAATIEALGHYATAFELARTRLLDTLTNGTQWERELTAGAIARHFGPDSEPFARLTGLTPWQIVRVLESTAAAPHGSELRRRYVTSGEALVRTSAIGNIPDARVDSELDLIRRAMSDPDVVVRAAGYDRYALTTADPEEVRLDALLRAEERERGEAMNDARLAAIQGLTRMEQAGRGAFLSSLLRDRDPVVRRIAAEQIAEKGISALPSFVPLPSVRSPEEYQEIVRWSREPHTATIHMTRGDIQLALLPQAAPITTWNFAQLARRGYFDNTSFMRVVPNFVIQGGDPRNDMNGGPGYAIRDEINLQKYTRGAVGMALSGPDTGGSQFFITHSPQPHLDGGYTIFGRVIDGMSSVVDQTERGDRVKSITIDGRPPATAAEIESVPNISLPLEVGEMTADRLIERIPQYRDLRDVYRPDIAVIEMMKSYVQAGDRMEIYMGTWCNDSQREVPKFLKIAEDLKEQYGVELPARYFALDRSKQKPENLVAGKELRSVATFIYYRGERELGRIVERPTSLFEDDLLAIAAAQ